VGGAGGGGKNGKCYKTYLLLLDSLRAARQSATMRHVILTNEQGHNLGTEDLQKAHAGKGHLHKAFSVFIFRKNRSELLIQQRSSKKPLFPMLWANTCCSHPQEGEGVKESAENRLQEECGFTCPLTEIASFIYRAPDPTGNCTEYEYDTIFVGDIKENLKLNPDPLEIEQLTWKPVEEIIRNLSKNPTIYAPWFPIALHAIFRNSDDN